MTAQTRPFRLVSYEMIKAACRTVAEELDVKDMRFCIYKTSTPSVYSVTCEESGEDCSLVRQIRRDLLRLVGEFLVMNYSASVEEVTSKNGNHSYELYLAVNNAAGTGFAGWPEPAFLDFDDPGHWS